MSRRPSHIPLRRPIYIGCEGMSEVGYAALLQDFASASRLPVHMRIDELAPGAGDPLSRVEMAVRRINDHRHKRIPFEAKFILLDEDQTALDLQRADRARRLAEENGIVIVWQRPCFEGVLLRHLPDRARRQPPDTKEAGRALVREWPDYRKPMARFELAQRITIEGVLRAAEVEPELGLLLNCIGLL